MGNLVFDSTLLYFYYHIFESKNADNNSTSGYFPFLQSRFMNSCSMGLTSDWNKFVIFIFVYSAQGWKLESVFYNVISSRFYSIDDLSSFNTFWSSSISKNSHFASFFFFFYFISFSYSLLFPLTNSWYFISLFNFF